MIDALKNKKAVYFTGCLSKTALIQENGAKKLYKHQTAFMRDFNVLDFTTNYIKQNFPNGTHIADFACSQGQEAHSLAILMDDANQAKKYKITGYDIIPKQVEYAQRGVFVIEPEDSESVLFEETKTQIQNQKLKAQSNQILTTFRKYFDTKNQPQNILQFATENFPENSEPNVYSKVAKVKKEKTEGILDFKVGDIQQTEKILESHKTGAVFFQNALYHIIGDDGAAIQKPDAERARSTFQQIHNILPDNGILVLGNLRIDHLYNYEKNKTTKTLAYQNNEQIKVFNSSPVHKVLREVGFEPIFYTEEPQFQEHHLPSVWKKCLPNKTPY